METKTKTWECPKCETETTDITGSGLCLSCEDLGYWVDPTGGMHFDDPNSDDFYDPAAMYE